MKTRVDEKKVLVLDQKDIVELLPDFDFKYTLYRDYRDEIDQSTFRKCMPDLEHFKDENGKYKWGEFVSVRECELENQIREWNRDYMTDDMSQRLREELKEALKKKGIVYDSFEFNEDVYMDELFNVDLDLDYLLKRSYVNWNVVWHNNFDGFNENEVYEDDGAIKQIVKLFPDLVDKNDLERACCDGMYAGSDLKVSFRHSMRDFLDIIGSGSIDLSGARAVLHLGINGSGSSDFILGKGKVEFGKTYDSKFDYWDWEFDGRYGIVDVYGQVMNDNR